MKQPPDSKESPYFISLGFWSGLAAHITASSVVHINISLSLYIYIYLSKTSQRQLTKRLRSQKQISIRLQTSLDSYQSLSP